jgi:hypothetical protein
MTWKQELISQGFLLYIFIFFNPRKQFNALGLFELSSILKERWKSLQLQLHVSGYEEGLSTLTVKIIFLMKYFSRKSLQLSLCVNSSDADKVAEQEVCLNRI